MPTLHYFDASRVHVFELTPLLPSNVVATARRRLITPGVALITASSVILSEADQADLDAIADSFDSLTPDPYDRSMRRFRAHGEFSFETNTGWPIITRLHYGTYRQSARFNPLEAGRERVFRSLPDSLLTPLLWRMVYTIFGCLPDSIQSVPTLRIQIHQFSYRARHGPAVSSPLGLHRDGEPYTAVVFIGKSDLWGGDTIVADEHGQLVLGHSLSEPLETLLLNDAAVVHAVTPVLRGRRDVLLVDFTPKVADVPL